jgi:hypothetical protein
MEGLQVTLDRGYAFEETSLPTDSSVHLVRLCDHTKPSQYTKPLTQLLWSAVPLSVTDRPIRARECPRAFSG